MISRKFNTVSKEVVKKSIDEVITRIHEIGDSEVGIIAAQDIIDIVVQNVGPEIYNMGIHDAKKLLVEKLADLETDIDILEQ